MANVLIVDDDRCALLLAFRAATAAGHRPFVAENGETAVAFARTILPDLAVVDVCLPGMNGIETVRRLRAGRPDLQVVIVGGLRVDKEMAAELKAEGFDFVEKPFDWRALLGRVDGVRSGGPGECSVPSGPRDDPYPELLGESTVMRRVFRLMTRLAPTTQTLLLGGETGTGKELVACAIHRSSPRHAGPFVPVNCAAVPLTLFEAEFFGCERGAFTDARATRAGWFEQANHGTLFLDEIGDVPLEGQAKLLRALERREVTRLGGSRAITVDVRVIAATNVEFEATVARGTLRRDFFHRLESTTLRLPPLRERGGDVRLLVDHYLATLATGLGGAPHIVSAEARAALLGYRWPGNIRELENALRQALTSAEGPVVEFGDLPASVRGAAIEPADLVPPVGISLPEGVRHVTERFERRQIQDALERCRGNQSAASHALGIDRKTLYQKMQRYGVTSRE
jgi:DNA-binding NtrC family response regulator